MRRLTLGVAAMLLFAGCLAASAQTESAMTLKDQAQDRADEKFDNPRLIGLWGVETPRHVESNDSELRVHLDDEPGDGNAAGWAFMYLGEQRMGIIVVADQIGVVAEYYEDIEDVDDNESQERPQALSWQVDSPEAAEILKANETWPTMTDAHAVSWELERDDNRTIWDVGASEVNLSGPDTDYNALVDAETGEILEVEKEEPYSFGPSMGTESEAEPPQGSEEYGGCNEAQGSGQVTPLSSVETDPASLPEEGRVHVSVSYSGAGSLDLALQESESDETVWDDSVTMAGGDTYDVMVEDLDSGDYSLEASTGAGSGNVALEIQAMWGSGGQCQWDMDYGPGTPGSVSGWIHTDRTLGVDQLT